MVKATSWEVFQTLKTASLLAAIVDGVNDTCYFTETISESAVRAILNPLGWTNSTLASLSSLTDADPHSQYLNVFRHDQLLRHPIGTVIPHDTTKIDSTYLDTDGTLLANSDAKIPTQKAVKTYAEPVIPTKNTAFNKNYGATATDVKINGTQAVGSVDAVARVDHVHPTDTGRAASSHNHDGTYCRWRGSSATEPTTPAAGDIWVDTTGTPTPKMYSGSAWISLI